MTPERRDAAIRHWERAREICAERLDHARKRQELVRDSIDGVVWNARELDAIDDAIEALKALQG